MNHVLLVIIIAISILLFLLLLALVLPKQYSVTVSETINQPKKVVYDYVSLFKHQRDYSEWIKADPDLRPTVKGTDGTVGAVMSWESQQTDRKKNIGSGEQEIKRMDEDRIEVELRLIMPMPATCQLVHEFEAKGENATRYTCTFSTYAKFPVNLPAYLLGRKFIARTQQKTLRNIKEILERS
jgi:hypothetical protein